MPITLEEFKNNSLTKFTKEITDIFFTFIENDRELLRDYMRVIGRDNDLDTTNKNLGSEVKDWFNLDNDGENKNPKSKLIGTYTYHKRKII